MQTGGSERERAVQAAILRLKCAACLHALGQAGNAEALLRRVLADVDALHRFEVELGGDPVVSPVDFYALPRP